MCFSLSALKCGFVFLTSPLGGWFDFRHAGRCLTWSAIWAPRHCPRARWLVFWGPMPMTSSYVAGSSSALTKILKRVTTVCSWLLLTRSESPLYCHPLIGHSFRCCCKTFSHCSCVWKAFLHASDLVLFPIQILIVTLADVTSAHGFWNPRGEYLLK